MTIARTQAVALTGLRGQLVEIQADLAGGLPGLHFTGLPDVSVVEARDRIRAAVVNSGIPWPDRKITLALLPADVRKVGSRFDLALAMAVLAAAGVVGGEPVAGAVWLAELGLDAKLRPVRGVLPAVIAARQAGVSRVVVAEANGPEAALVTGVDIRTASDLTEILGWLGGSGPPLRRAAPGDRVDPPDPLDLADVTGQVIAKRGLELSAAGGHHLYLLGAPGAGKTMLAERLPGLLPPLEEAAALEVTAVHSVAGALAGAAGMIKRPPMQAPHHTASVAALVGGGSGLARPGAISLAHHGVLLLDEAPEFSAAAIEALRQPLESGEVVIHRSLGAVRYPARFQLVIAANPCPCGRRGRDCTCAPQARRRYIQRLSGPLLDRVDVRVYMDPLSRAELTGPRGQDEDSATVAARVRDARAVAAQRWSEYGWQLNASVTASVLWATGWRLPRSVLAVAEAHAERGELSARGLDRVLRMSWTIADLAGRTSPNADDVAEALFFRSGRNLT
jgi:magnesium chelatase family protein